jgi:hypothetical protein
VTYVYAVPNEDIDSGDGDEYFATKAKAIASARELVKYGIYESVGVKRYTVANLPRRQLITTLLNRYGWAEKMETVASIPGRKTTTTEIWDDLHPDLKETN